MRPRPSEIVTGVRAILKDVIGPELSSEHAKSRLSEVRAVLAQVDWDNAGFALAARNAALLKGLADAQEWSGQELPGWPENDDFEAHQLLYEKLAMLLIEALQLVRLKRMQKPDDGDLRELHDQLISLA